MRHIGARTVVRFILKRILFQHQIQRLMCATVKLAQVMNLAQCFNLRKFRHPAVKAKAPPCGGADVTQFDLSARLTQFLAKVLHLQHHVQFILRAQTRTFHRTPSPVDRRHEPEPLESLRCLRLVPCETKHLSGAPCQGQFPAHLCELPTVRAERSNSRTTDTLFCRSRRKLPPGPVNAPDFFPDSPRERSSFGHRSASTLGGSTNVIPIDYERGCLQSLMAIAESTRSSVV